jgi:hypothetical protein
VANFPVILITADEDPNPPILMRDLGEKTGKKKFFSLHGPGFFIQ